MIQWHKGFIYYPYFVSLKGRKDDGSWFSKINLVKQIADYKWAENKSYKGYTGLS
jgi:hypothetical protein